MAGAIHTPINTAADRRAQFTCAIKDEKVIERDGGPGKLLDVDGQYYQQLSSSRPPPRLAAGTPTLREGRVREQAATEADSHRTDGDSRGCVATTISTNSQTKENPYDFRHLLRKTSQRRKLIKQH